MSEGEGPAGAESHHDPQPTHVVRAVVLVAVGITLGAILLHSIGRAPTGSVAAGSATSTPSPATAATAPPPPTTTTTAAARPPAQVKTLAANGTKTSGAAEKVSTTLRNAGYNVLAPTNTTASAPSSAVYYTPGFVSEAGAVASALGLAPTTVMALPTPPPVSSTRGADVVVVIGPDLAGQGAPAAGAASTTTSAPTPTTAPPTTSTVH